MNIKQEYLNLELTQRLVDEDADDDVFANPLLGVGVVSLGGVAMAGEGQEEEGPSHGDSQYSSLSSSVRTDVSLAGGRAEARGGDDRQASLERLHIELLPHDAIGKFISIYIDFCWLAGRPLQLL